MNQNKTTNVIENRDFSEWWENTAMLEIESCVTKIQFSNTDWDLISSELIAELFPDSSYMCDEARIRIYFRKSFIEIESGSHVSTVKIRGDGADITEVCARLSTKIEQVKSKISWVYGEYGETTLMKIANRPLIRAAYPNIDNLEKYFEDFVKSSANVLILIGPPGTGKTTFIRGLLNHCELSATVTFESQLLAKDSFFADFISGKSNVLIMEDADVFLSARVDGNTMMHKFLNMSDGLISGIGKKIIFSTNLPSIKSVDEALIRPGRCFDVLEFGKLTTGQAAQVAAEAGVEYNGGHTIAEIFAPINEHLKTKKGIGF